MSSISKYKLLPPDADLAAIAVVVRDCIQKMQEQKKSYDEIADLISANGVPITAEAIKTFVSRRHIKRINRNNHTLETLYNFLEAEQGSIDEEIQGQLIENLNVFAGRRSPVIREDEMQRMHRAKAFATLFYNWFSITETEIMRVSSKLCDEYVILRKSMKHKDMIVKSNLVVKLDDSRKLINVSHFHLDRQGIKRVSQGFLISVLRNIYVLLRIDDAEGFEVIALKEPIQFSFLKMMGFMLTINMDRKIISARVFMERDSEIWQKFKPRFYTDDPLLKNYPEIKDMVNSLLDKETSLTLPEVVLTEAFSDSRSNSL